MLALPGLLLVETRATLATPVAVPVDPHLEVGEVKMQEKVQTEVVETTRFLEQMRQMRCQWKQQIWIVVLAHDVLI